MAQSNTKIDPKEISWDDEKINIAEVKWDDDQAGPQGITWDEPEGSDLGFWTKMRHAVQPVPALAAAGVLKAAAGGARLINQDEWAEEAAQQVRDVVMEINKEHPLGSESWYAALRNALTSTYTQIPGLATGNRPVALTWMGLQSGLAGVEEAVERGASKPVALAAGTIKGISEAATEYIPVTKLFGKAAPLKRRLLELLASEIPGESINTSVDWGVEKVLDKYLDQDTVDSDSFWRDIKMTLKTVLLQSGVMGTGSHMVHKITGPSAPAITYGDKLVESAVEQAVEEIAMQQETPAEVAETLAGVRKPGHRYIAQKSQTEVGAAQIAKRGRKPDTDIVTTGDRMADEELLRAAPKWKKTVQSGVARAFDYGGWVIPESVKGTVGKFLSNPYFGSEGNPQRRVVVDLNLARGEERSSDNYDLYVANPETGYLGIEGMTRAVSRLSKPERQAVSWLIKYGDIGKLEWDLENLATDNNPFGVALSPDAIQAYAAFRQTIGATYEMLGRHLQELSILPYENKPWFSQLQNLIEKGVTEEQVLADETIPAEVAAAFERVNRNKGKLAEIKSKIREWPGLAPRIRPDGEWFVRGYEIAKDGHQEEVYMRPARTRAGAQRLLNKVNTNRKKALKTLYSKDAKYKFVVEQNPSIPEPLYQFKGADIAIERILNRAIERAKETGRLDFEEAEVVADSLITTVAEQIAARGFGRHRIARAPNLIEGYDDDNYLRTLLEYVHGATGWTSKAKFALRSSLAANSITDPHDKVWAQSYVSDMMKNATHIDQVMSVGRTYAALMYLAYKVSTSVLNATQNYVVGQAELSRYTKFPTSKLLKAQKDVIAKKYTPEEERALHEGLRRGRTQPQYVREVAGLAEAQYRKGPNKVMTDLTRWGMVPFQLVESHWNREPALLAAYRVFRNEKGLAPDEALRHAEAFVNKVHFVIGKENMPELLRKLGAVGQTAYVFQSYTHNYLLWLTTRMRQGELGPVARSLMAVSVLGGLKALPGADDIEKWLRRSFGHSPFLALRQWLKATAGKYTDAGEQITDFVLYGLPSFAGVDWSRALGVTVPFLKGDDSTLAERFTGVWSGLATKTKVAMIAVEHGDWARALENSPLTPEAVANIFRATRQSDRGMTTMAGKLLLDPEDRPMRYTLPEAVRKGLGFSPLRPSKYQEARWAATNLRKYWNDRRSGLIAKLRIADTVEEAERIAKEIYIFNRELAKSQAAPLIPPITGSTLRRSLKTRPDKRRRAFMEEYLD